MCFYPIPVFVSFLPCGPPRHASTLFKDVDSDLRNKSLEIKKKPVGKNVFILI
jgi:hypothetical protein